MSKLDPNARWRWLHKPNPFPQGCGPWRRTEIAAKMGAGTVAQLIAATQSSTPNTLLLMGLIEIEGAEKEKPKEKPKRQKTKKTENDIAWAESLFDENIHRVQINYSDDLAYQHYRKVWPMPDAMWECFQQLDAALHERIKKYNECDLVNLLHHNSANRITHILRHEIVDYSIKPSPGYAKPVPPLPTNDPFTVLRQEITDFERKTERYIQLFNQLKQDRIAADALAKKFSAKAKLEKGERARKRAAEKKARQERMKERAWSFKQAAPDKNAEHLAVLNLSSNATSDQIKASYRDMIKQLHPDSNKNATKADVALLQKVLSAMQALRAAGRVVGAGGPGAAGAHGC